MAGLGSVILLLAFVATAYSGFAAVAGARQRSRRLIESAQGAFYAVAALTTVASAIIIHAFVTHDYSIKYVQRYSDSTQPLFYLITSYWGGLDGSLLFWVFLLAVFGSIAVYVNKESSRELMPYIIAVMCGVMFFFEYILIFHKNPFDTFLVEIPAEGKGLNPLLQNPYMATHPPLLYAGFVGMTIPYAFGMSALITGNLDDSWLRPVRRWVMIAWLCLSAGLTLGMLWAYEELGWGGYWGWDPVENAGFLPWLTATAFYHSVMVQERRGMLRIWNISLIILTFFLTIFGTFMTRSGIVQSVHAFGQDTKLAWMFTGFMATIVIFSFGLVIDRLSLLRSRNQLDSWLSREAAFLANNWVLLFAALFVLFATMFPTISEAVTGERLTIGEPFYIRWMRPIGLILLLLTGVGPLIAWRKSTLSNLRYQFLWPVTSGLVVAGGLLAAGVRVWSSGLCFALCAFVFASITQEFVRGARVRQRASGSDVFTALVGLVARSRRRYGGYIVHLGIVLMFLGFAGGGFKREEQVNLRPGEQVEVGRYTVRFDRIGQADDGDKQMITGDVTVFEKGKQLAVMHPAKWFFRHHEDEPTTEIALRRMPSEDLYIVMPAYDLQQQVASLKVVVNPLVNWIWVGFVFLTLGTAVALLPESAFAFAQVKIPAGAATTALAAIFVLALGAGVLAQHAPTGKTVPLPPKTQLEKDLYDSIICMCGTCGRRRIGECDCGLAGDMREEVSTLVKQGKTRDQVLLYYVQKYGSEEPLASPIDKGFNRLAWLVPYLLGFAGAAIAGGFALKWARPAATREPETPPPADDQLLHRLDDELNKLD